MKKQCSKCGKKKNHKFFNRHHIQSDGLYPSCKSCEKKQKDIYRASPKGKAVHAWNDIKKRLRNQKEYAHVRITVDKESFLKWAAGEFSKWMTKHPDERPSIDRKNPKLNYSLDNMRVISLSDNCRLRSNTYNPTAPEGTAWCSLCRSYRSTKLFDKNSSRPNGLQARCKTCRRPNQKVKDTSYKSDEDH